METYPMPAPENDGRFTYGLLFDLAEVLERRGYPPITAGSDLVRLQQSIFPLPLRQAHQR